MKWVETIFLANSCLNRTKILRHPAIDSVNSKCFWVSSHHCALWQIGYALLTIWWLGQSKPLAGEHKLKHANLPLVEQLVASLYRHSLVATVPKQEKKRWRLCEESNVQISVAAFISLWICLQTHKCTYIYTQRHTHKRNGVIQIVPNKQKKFLVSTYSPILTPVTKNITWLLS